MVRDDRASGGVDPPAIIYSYMPGRGGMWAEKLLGDYHGILQVDGYEAYGQFGKAGRPGGPYVLAYCWAHVRRGFLDVGGKDGKTAVQGKGVLGRLDIGVRRTIQKK